jgi:DNA polymerase I
VAATLWQIESDFIRLMARIKQRGIKIDTAFSRAKVIEGTRILNQIRGELGWNPGSSQQVGKYLVEELGLPVLKRSEKTGQPSFDKAAMEEYESYLEPLQNETAKKVLTYRGWQKTVSSNYQAYLDLMDDDQILHPNYKVHGTRTARLSCEKPNLQQIPRYDPYNPNPKPWNGDVKKAFIVRNDGLFHYSFDFKQVEFRLAAAYAKEKRLLEIFNSGADIFTEMAAELSRPRPQIKTFVYSTLYGAGKAKVALVLGMPREESDALYEEYHGRWPGFKRITEKATQLATNDGYIEYWTGRRRHLNKQEARKAFNAVIQGGAFEIVKRRMLALKDEPIILQVHDSITCEADNSYDIDRIKKVLEDVPEAETLGVKFAVDLEIAGAT